MKQSFERIEKHLYRRQYQTAGGEWSTLYYARFKDWKGKARMFPLGSNVKAAQAKLKGFPFDPKHGALGILGAIPETAKIEIKIFDDEDTARRYEVEMILKIRPELNKTIFGGPNGNRRTNSEISLSAPISNG